MKKLMSLVALLFALGLAFNGACFAWGTSGGDGSNYGQLQETAVFFNNSGAKLVHGQAVVLDLDGTGVTTGTTMGAYVETLIATADSNLAVGVVKVAADDQTPVIVVTRGPIDALVNDSSEAIAAASTVGTGGSGTTGTIGAGSNLGIALEAGAGTDGDYLYIWVCPANSD